MMPSRPERQSLRAPLRDATLRRSYLIRVFGLIWTAARGWTVAWGILLVVQGLMPVALVYLTKPLVDGLQAAVGRGTSWETVRPVLLVVVGIGSVLLLTELLKVCLEWIGTAQSELVQDHITDGGGLGVHEIGDVVLNQLRLGSPDPLEADLEQLGE